MNDRNLDLIVLALPTVTLFKSVRDKFKILE